MYTRLKEDKDQRVNFSSFSNPMYSGASSSPSTKNDDTNDSKSKCTIKTYVPVKK